MKLPVIIGQIIYVLGYPVIRVALYKSKRSYVAITCKDEVLLTVDWLSAHHQNRLPGGGIKRGEDAKLAVSRELEEEIGLKTSINELKPLINNKIDSHKGFEYYLFSLNLNKKPKIKTSNFEVLYTVWVSRHDINKYKLGLEAEQALKAMGWL